MANDYDMTKLNEIFQREYRGIELVTTEVIKQWSDVDLSHYVLRTHALGIKCEDIVYKEVHKRKTPLWKTLNGRED